MLPEVPHLMSLPATSVPPTGLLIVSTCVETGDVPPPPFLSGSPAAGGIAIPRPSIGTLPPPPSAAGAGLFAEGPPEGVPVTPPVGAAGRMRTTARMIATAATTAAAI